MTPAKHKFEYHNMNHAQLCAEWERSVGVLLAADIKNWRPELEAMLKRLATPAYPLNMLTARQAAVFEFALTGISYREGAAMLHICVGTFSTHLQAAKKKLGIKSQRAFILFGVKHKLIESPV